MAEVQVTNHSNKTITLLVGKLTEEDLLTRDQWAAVKARLAPYPAEDETDLIHAIGVAVWNYQEAHVLYSGWPSRKRTRAKMLQIHKAARKLRTLLEGEFFEHRVINTPYYDKNGKRLHSPSVCRETLTNIERESGDILAGVGSDVGPLTRKSAVRFLLWDPLIAVWAKAGRSVGYSEGGPIEQFISTVQVSCGLPRPSGLSIRQAVEEWSASAVR